MASNLMFLPLPDGAHVRDFRDTQQEASGTQLDGAVIECREGAFNHHISVMVSGSGLKHVSTVTGVVPDSGVLTGNSLFISTAELVVDLEVFSETGTGPFTVLVVFDQIITEYDDKA